MNTKLLRYLRLSLSLPPSVYSCCFSFFFPLLLPFLSFHSVLRWKAGYKLRGSLASSFISRQGKDCEHAFYFPLYVSVKHLHLLLSTSSGWLVTLVVFFGLSFGVSACLDASGGLFRLSFPPSSLFSFASLHSLLSSISLLLSSFSSHPHPICTCFESFTFPLSFPVFHPAPFLLASFPCIFFTCSFPL